MLGSTGHNLLLARSKVKVKVKSLIGITDLILELMLLWRRSALVDNVLMCSDFASQLDDLMNKKLEEFPFGVIL